MVTNSYNAAANVFNSPNPSWPTPDGVTWWSVSSVAVPGNDICGDDMSMLRLSQPMNGVCPLIPAVDTPAADNSTYKAVGFGITSPGGQTAGTRYEVSGMTVICFGASDCQDNTISSTLEWIGGSNAQQGTCEGDSGGPALDSSNRVIGTVSRGPQNACNQTVYESTSAQAAWIKSQAQAAASAGGYTVAKWVTGGATSNPANGYPCSGTTSSSSSGTTSSSSSSSGSTGGVPTDCTQADQGIGCCVGNVNYYCTTMNTVGNQNCAQSGQVCGWDSSNTYYGCVSPPASSDPSGMYPLACAGSSGSTSSGTTSSSSGHSSSSGGTADGGTGGTGGGTGAGGYQNVGNTSGCSVSSSSGSAPTSPASLAGLLLGAALVASRRRR
jgi:MYXO-CTERM domain-containing protein